MKYNTEIFKRQYPILQEFILHAKYAIILRSLPIKNDENSFYSYTLTSHIEKAVILWCKVFGVESNKTHWKEFINLDNELKKKFTNGLINKKSWEKFWNDMINFRNKYVCHSDSETEYIFPGLQKAIDVSIYYDNFIRDIISPDILIEPPLDKFSKKITDKFYQDFHNIYCKIEGNAP